MGIGCSQEACTERWGKTLGCQMHPHGQMTSAKGLYLLESLLQLQRQNEFILYTDVLPQRQAHGITVEGACCLGSQQCSGVWRCQAHTRCWVDWSE